MSAYNKLERFVFGSFCGDQEVLNAWLVRFASLQGSPESRNSKATVAAKLIAKVKQSGSFGYASVLPDSLSAQNPRVKIMRVLTQPDPSKVRHSALILVCTLLTIRAFARANDQPANLPSVLAQYSNAVVLRFALQSGVSSEDHDLRNERPL